MSILVSGIICSASQPDMPIILLASLSGAMIGGAGNIINDYYDYNIDLINRPNRPITSGKISKSEALFSYAVVSFVAISMAALINLTSFAIALISMLLIHFYSSYFKKLVLLGNIMVSFFTGLAFVYGGAAVGSIEQSIIPACFAFLVNLTREIVKDIEDIAGDSLNNIKTFPHYYGIDLTKKLLIVLISLIMLLTPIPFIMNIYNVEYFVIIMVFVNVIFVYILKLLFIKSSEQNTATISRLLKINMIIGLAAVLMGVKLG